MKPSIIIFIVGSLVTARVPVHSGFGGDEWICATSRALTRSYWLCLGVLFLVVITVVNLQVRTARWLHLSLRLIFIG